MRPRRLRECFTHLSFSPVNDLSLFYSLPLLIRSECKPIDYPAPDGKLSFDILTSVSMTNTNHAENQPIHLRLPETEGAKKRHTETNVKGTSSSCPTLGPSL